MSGPVFMNGGPKHYTREEVQGEVASMVKSKATIIFWHEGVQKIAYLLARDNAQWKQELKNLRQQVKAGKITAIEWNNKDCDSGNNRIGTWYQLVLQSPGEDCGNQSPLSILGFNEMVNGIPYYFKRKSDRDNAYKYLLTGKVS